MTATFLLGAGVSLPAGMPSVKDIGEAIRSGIGRSGPFLRHTDGTYYSSTSDVAAHAASVAALHKLDPSVDQLRSFLEKIRENVGEYFSRFGNYNSQSVTYEHLAYVVTQVSDALSLEYENPGLGPLIGKLEPFADEHFGPDIDLAKLCSETAVYLRWAVCDLLSRPAQRLDHLRAVVDACLDASVKRVDVITLNHDTLIEQVLRQSEVPFTDGFDFDGTSSDCRFWNPQLFEGPSAKVRLLKLHGSIDWYRFQSECTPTRQRLGIATNADPDHFRDQFGQFQTRLGEPEILLGTFNKMLDYTGGAFADLFCLFRRILSTANTLMVSGYGFRDKGVNRVIVEWVKRSQENRLVIIHRSHEKFGSEARGAIRSLFHFAPHQIVGSPTWMEEASWPDMSAKLRQVRS